jgi:hypothetical protein
MKWMMKTLQIYNCEDSSYDTCLENQFAQDFKIIRWLFLCVILSEDTFS